jgi:hypothetical protein
MAPVAIGTTTPFTSTYSATSRSPAYLKSLAKSTMATTSTSTGKRPQEILDAPARTSFTFDAMEDAIAAYKRGEFLVVMDDEGRENEGDLIVAAEKCSTEMMAWMIKYTRYVIMLLVA